MNGCRRAAGVQYLSQASEQPLLHSPSGTGPKWCLPAFPGPTAGAGGRDGQMDGQIPGAAVGNMPGEQRLGLGMQSGHPAALREARPGLFHPPMVWWEPPLGCSEGLLPLGPRGCSWPAVSRLAERCQCSYSWPSLADSLALWESAVISSVIKGLRACSTPLKKQENNNNDLCSGMLLSGIRIAFTAFWLRKLLMLQL